MLSTGDLAVQVKVAKMYGKQLCIKTVLVRYGTSVMSMDVSGPAKNFRDYSIMYLTTSTNGLRYIPGASEGVHILNFPYGSSLTVKIVNNNGIMSLDLIILLYPGYSSPKAKDVLTNPGATALQPSIQFGTVCKIPDNLQPKPVDPVLPKPVDPIPPKPVDPIPPKPVDPSHQNLWIQSHQNLWIQSRQNL
ncbi:hypothetical protein BASA61_009194 [Batrachochytrium salamandrivorans]|nr:hypothetical protein BASA61_009194 [Batrachochytrium salamandrivorans]